MGSIRNENRRTDAAHRICAVETDSGQPQERPTVLSVLGLEPEQTAELAGKDRSHLSALLLRWAEFDALHACLDASILDSRQLVSLRDLRAKAFLAQDRAEEALSIMQERVKRRSSLPARALLAPIHLARADVTSARQVVQAMLSEADESAMAWSLLGEVELVGGDEEAALSACRCLHALYTHSRAYLWGMNRIYRSCGDWVTASGYATQLLDLSTTENRLSVAYLQRLRDYFKGQR